jgi:DNA-binding NarL/FixJ family response regulator
VSEPIRVLVADDEQLVRAGLRMIIEAAEAIDVVGEAVDGADAVAKVRSLDPDVVLMDVQMPRLNGIDATRRILAGARGRPRVVVLTTFSQSEIVYDALTAGASGFLLKDMPAEHLISGIRAVARGEELLAPALTRQLIEQFVATSAPRSSPQLERLTDREREVLVLLARGLSNAEIAQHLTLGLETVKTHVSRILDKLGVRDRVQAVVFAYESGIVSRAGGEPS